jgi:hypothetical protein
VDVEHGQVRATCGQQLQRLRRVGGRVYVQPHALAAVIAARDGAEDPRVVGVGGEVQQERDPARPAAAPAPGEYQPDGERGQRCRSARYQCTPFIRLAIAICSIEAFSSGSFLPLAAAESGNTL